jgi:hypothetical protein
MRYTAVLVAAVLGVLAPVALAQPFTYQGRLAVGGLPANNAYDMRFRVYDQLTGGLQLGVQSLALNTQVTDGLFTALVSTFTNASQTRPEMYLEIDVRPAGVGNYTTLGPRTRLAATPLAVRSLNERWSPQGASTLVTDPSISTVLINVGGPQTSDAVLTVSGNTTSPSQLAGIYMRTSANDGQPYIGLAPGNNGYVEARYNGANGLFSLVTRFGTVAPIVVPVQINSSGNTALGTAPDSVNRLRVNGSVRADGGMQANSYAYNAAQTRIYSITPQDLQPREFGPGISGTSGASNGTAGFDAAVGTALLVAGVRLPQGATVTRMDVIALDNTAAADMSISFGRREWAATAFNAITTVSTSGTSATPVTLSDNGSSVIDNDTYAYTVSVFSTDWQGVTLLGIKGIKIFYTVSAPD